MKCNIVFENLATGDYIVLRNLKPFEVDKWLCLINENGLYDHEEYGPLKFVRIIKGH